jgi:aspartate racemase
MKPIVGVLGGMGPAATILFLDRLVRFATASIDQDHLKSVVMMNCEIPDRSSAIIRKDDGPLIAMVEGLTNLEKVGVDFIAIPCNTAMYWFQQLSDLTTVPILNIIAETSQVLRDAGVDAVHLWGTNGTYQSGIYERHLNIFDIKIIRHSTQTQSVLDDVIASVKRGQHKGFKDQLAEPINHLSHYDSDIPVVLACTEFSLAFQNESMGIPYVDSSDCLALRCLELAKVEHEAPEWLAKL